jgi:putative endonuclease
MHTKLNALKNNVPAAQLSFQFDAEMGENTSPLVRRDRGRRAYLAGQSAEKMVLRDYLQRGYELAAQRWRGGGAEIDLIFHDGNGCVFVEVKQSASFDRAINALRPAQVQRLMQAATVFVAGELKGQLTDMRFDVALVNGRGEIQIIENALWAA